MLLSPPQIASRSFTSRNQTRPARLLRLAVAGLLASFLPNVSSAASETVRLSEVLSVRFVQSTDGTAQQEAGLLNASGAFRIFDRQPVGRNVVIPAELLNRFLISGPSWFAYDVLGSTALSNFKIGTPPTFVGEQLYLAIGVAENPQPTNGELVNLSTRATLLPGQPPIISGFVISGGPRRTLIRGVGPALTTHGVSDALADPSLKVFRAGSDLPIATNGDWGQNADADAIERAATATGAFPLRRDSKDAACLVTLEAGVYTVQITGGDSNATGTALVEIYSVP